MYNGHYTSHVQQIPISLKTGGYFVNVVIIVLQNIYMFIDAKTGILLIYVHRRYDICVFTFPLFILIQVFSAPAGAVLCRLPYIRLVFFLPSLSFPSWPIFPLLPLLVGVIAMETKASTIASICWRADGIVKSISASRSFPPCLFRGGSFHESILRAVARPMAGVIGNPRRLLMIPVMPGKD